MKLASQVALTTFVLLTVLCLVTAGGTIPNVSAAATVSLSYIPPFLQLNVQSPVGVSGWEVEVDIPSGVSVATASGSGFMAGATSLSDPPHYRWFNLQANGQTAGSLTIPLTFSGTYTITLSNVGWGLKDANNNIITLDTILPIIVNVGSPNSTSTNTSFSTTSSTTTSSPITTTSTTKTPTTAASSTATSSPATVTSSTLLSTATTSTSSLQSSSAVTTGSSSTFSVTSSVAVTVARTTTLLSLPESSGGALAHVQVSSNSTLTGLQFDSSRRVLNFTASGPSGSVGFTLVVVGKSLIDGPPMVLVDNGRTSLLSLSVTSNSTHYFIGLFYPHSTHLISIGGGNALPEFHGDLTQIALILVSALLLFQVRPSKRHLGRLRD